MMIVGADGPLFACLLLNVYSSSQFVVLKQTPLGSHSHKCKIKISHEGSFGFVIDTFPLSAGKKQQNI